MCSLSNSNEVVANSEHMDVNTANVSFIQEKLSMEAFGGSSVKLLNSHNILIADAGYVHDIICSCIYTIVFV